MVERSLLYQALDQQVPCGAKSSPMKPTMHESENRRSTWRYSFSARGADDIDALACAVNCVGRRCNRLAEKGLVDRWQLLEIVPTGSRRAETRRDPVRFAKTSTLVVAMIAAAAAIVRQPQSHINTHPQHHERGKYVRQPQKRT